MLVYNSNKAYRHHLSSFCSSLKVLGGREERGPGNTHHCVFPRNVGPENHGTGAFVAVLKEGSKRKEAEHAEYSFV